MPGDQLGVGGGPGFLPPRAVTHPLKFPPAGKIAQLRGRVAMLVYIQTDGGVAQVHVLRSSGFCPFDNEAQRAVPHWRFASATSFGKPIATWWVVTVEFRNGGPSDRPVMQPLPPIPQPAPTGRDT
jgi:TonB family protein